MEKFQVAAVFSDSCVLQRGKAACVFGRAEDGLRVGAKFFGADKALLRESSCVSRGGEWLLRFEPLPAMDGCSMEIFCEGEKVSLSDISVGEVWLAGGQSNMEFELQNCAEGPDEMARREKSGVRFYYTNKIAWMDDKFFEAERRSAWRTWEGDWKKNWSAVGYFFAQRLSEDLGVTVGVIGCNWGGTSASAWIPRSLLEGDSELREYLAEYDEAAKGKSIDEQCAEFDAYEKANAEWQKKYDALCAERPGIDWDEAQKILGATPWPGPKVCKNPFRPAGLYECMLRRVMPYTIEGFLYYQGESDDHRAQSYRKLFSTLIQKWREDWGDISLPFVFVQLPRHRYSGDRDFKNWCVIREAQAQVAGTTKNCGMVCALDLGQHNAIHPVAKKALALRMERMALCVAYKMEDERFVSSPELESWWPRGGEIVARFSNAQDGFVWKDDSRALAEYAEMEKAQGRDVPPDFNGFEVAGRDGIFYPARAKFSSGGEGLNVIEISSCEVKEPAAARYAWYNYGPATVFSRTGLPLAPFRT